METPVADYLPRQYQMRLKARELVTSFTDDELREMGCDPDKLREWMSKLTRPAGRTSGFPPPGPKVVQVTEVNVKDLDGD